MCLLLGIQSITRLQPTSPNFSKFLLFRSGECGFQSRSFAAGYDRVLNLWWYSELNKKSLLNKMYFRSFIFKYNPVRIRREKLRSSIKIFSVYWIFKLPENLILGVWWLKNPRESKRRAVAYKLKITQCSPCHFFVTQSGKFRDETVEELAS